MASQGIMQESCPTNRYQCLFTHDLRRKAKRWQDGYLRYHSFNRRVMVYDTSGYLIGDTHWRHDMALQDGDELELDKGIMVQVGELLERKETDLSQLMQRKRARSQDSSSANQVNITGQPSPRVNTRGKPTGKPRSLKEILGIDSNSAKRPIAKRKSPYELRQESSAVSSPESRAPVMQEAKKWKPECAPPIRSMQVSNPDTACKEHPSMDKENGSSLTPATKKVKEKMSPRTPSKTPGYKAPLMSIQNNAISRTSSVNCYARADQEPRESIKQKVNETAPAPVGLERQPKAPKGSTHDVSRRTPAEKPRSRKASPKQGQEAGPPQVQESPKQAPLKQPVISTRPNNQGHDREQNISKQSPHTPHTSRNVSRSSSSTTRSGSSKHSDDRPMATLHMAPEKRRKKLMFMDILSTAKKSPPNPPASRDINATEAGDDARALGGFQSAHSLKSSRTALKYPPGMITDECIDNANQSIHQFFGPGVKSEDTTTTDHDNDTGRVVKNEPSEMDIRTSRLAEIPEHNDTSPPEDGPREDSNLPDAVPDTPIAPDNDYSVPSSAERRICDDSITSRNNKTMANRIKTEASNESVTNRASTLSQRSPARYFAELRSRSIATKD